MNKKRTHVETSLRRDFSKSSRLANSSKKIQLSESVKSYQNIKNKQKIAYIAASRNKINQKKIVKNSTHVRNVNFKNENKTKIEKLEFPKIEKLEFRIFPNMSASFKHSGDIGDIIYSMPVMRYLGGGTLFLNESMMGKKLDGSNSGLTMDLIAMLTPLLEAQPYIKKVEIFDKKYNPIINIDKFRERWSISGSENLCNKILYAFSTPYKEIESPWINCEAKQVAEIVFARSNRYRSEKTTYKNILGKNKSAIFVGLPCEHKDFIQNFGYVPYYPVKNFLEMAEVIKGCNTFVGNQSGPLSLAVAMHKPFIQEADPFHNHCAFNYTGADYMKK